MEDLFGSGLSQQEADRRARRWVESVDRGRAVGARHHIVPRFLLARFADERGRLHVRDRRSGKSSFRSAGDLAVRDFYTSVAKDRVLDGTLESLLGVVEQAAANVFRQHLDMRSICRARPFTGRERDIVDHFVSLQAVRGMRTRRSIEVLTDLGVKLTNQHRLAPREIEELEFVSHPNEHIRLLGCLAESVEAALRARPLCVVRLDKPLLIIGDEPVVCDKPLAGGADGRVQVDKNLIVMEGGRGFGVAEYVLLPVSPSFALLFGQTGSFGPAAEVVLGGSDAIDFAHEVNDLVVDTSVDWIAAHPDNNLIGDLIVDRPRSVILVHDNGSPVSSRANSVPARKPVRRLRPSDVDDVMET